MTLDKPINLGFEIDLRHISIRMDLLLLFKFKIIHQQWFFVCVKVFSLHLILKRFKNDK